jgi:ribulose bisphosphate carboxylase small subunit
MKAKNHDYWSYWKKKRAKSHQDAIGELERDNQEKPQPFPRFIKGQLRL